MSQTTQSSGVVLFIATLIVGFCLAGVHLPEQLESFRPEWVVLILLYWIIVMPYQIGVYTAATIGLLLDVFLGTALGQHMLSLSVVTYITYLLHKRIRIFPIWQQCLTIFLLVGIYQLINRMIQGLVGGAPIDISYYFPTFVSAFIWPWVYLVLRGLRRFYQVAES